jgi:16S rRNA (guanine966-N2)-methyltransferase
MFGMLDSEARRRGFEPEPDPRGGYRFAMAAAWPRVLELYAGSGALAIEALSRGATHADLVESSAEARRAIVLNLERTGLAGQGIVHALASERAVATFRGPYDLILLDPPYDDAVLPLLEHLASGELLARDGVLVWEHARAVTPPERLGERPDGAWLILLRTRSHGSGAVSLYAPTETRATSDPA